MNKDNLPVQLRHSATEEYSDKYDRYILTAKCGCVTHRSMHCDSAVWCAYPGFACCATHGGYSVNLFGQRAERPGNIGGGIYSAGRAFPEELMPGRIRSAI